MVDCSFDVVRLYSSISDWYAFIVAAFLSSSSSVAS